MKLAMAVGGAVVALLGVVASVTIGSGGGPNGSPAVAAREATGPTPTADGTAPATASAVTPPAGAPTTVKEPSMAPAHGTTPPNVPRTPLEVQQFIAGITAQLQASTATQGGTTPVTKEQVEAEVRAQLQQLGINL